MLIDAHNHLHDLRLGPFHDAIVAEMEERRIERCVVNGVKPADWGEVAALAQRFPDVVVPCFGLHPWFIQNRTASWETELCRWLDRFPAAGVGEIGLDKWIRDHRIEEQEKIFRTQLRIAAERNRPAMIHCLKAWGRLLDVLREEPIPDCGFLLHSFAGPAEMIPDFIELGAHFSFSGYFLNERKADVRKAFESVPIERLLIETDAPDMNLPESQDRYHLKTEDDKRINHPGNLDTLYFFVAESRGIDIADLEIQMEENLARLLGKESA